MSFLDVIKAIIPLVVIIGLLYGVLLLIKKYGISFKSGKTGLIPISVLSSQMIMPKKFISIVKVDNKLLVLGVSDNSITLLKELESLEKNDKVQVNDDNKTNFLEILKKNLGIR